MEPGTERNEVATRLGDGVVLLFECGVRPHVGIHLIGRVDQAPAGLKRDGMTACMLLKVVTLWWVRRGE